VAIVINQKNLPVPDKPLQGFSGINRYWDRQRGVFSAKILPGEYYVTVQDELITTVLGSCVSACIRDPAMRIGGMNHFMLPSGNSDSRNIANEATRYGNFAMEKMINDILKNGGRREKLEIKVFGGGNVLKNMGATDIGGKNAQFVRDYLRMEGFNIIAEDLGDVYPRKVIYDPITGKVQVKKLRCLHNDTINRRELGYQHDIEQEPVAGDIELFD